MNDLLPWLIVAGLIWLVWKIYGDKKSSTSGVVQPVVSSPPRLQTQTRPLLQPQPQPQLQTRPQLQLQPQPQPKTPPIVNSPPKQDPQTRHIQKALSFAKTQHRELEKKQREHAAWERNYGLAQVHELDKLGGVEFEK
jgi:hypothetical protein